MKTRIITPLLFLSLLTGQAHGMAREKKGDGCWEQLKTTAKHTAGAAATSLATGAVAALVQNEAFKQQCIEDDRQPNWLIKCTWKACRTVCLEYNHAILTGSPYCVDSTIHCYPTSQLYMTADDAWHAYLDPVALHAIPIGVMIYTLLRCASENAQRDNQAHAH